MQESTDGELAELREIISQYYLMDENDLVIELLRAAKLPDSKIHNIQQTARRLVINVRKSRLRSGGLDAFLFEYDLSSEEGIALMCMAEALLRIPDSKTRDMLIKDKITSSDWNKHIGSSSSSFVNAATWGLMLTGQIISNDKVNSGYLKTVLGKAIKRGSEPIIRQSVSQAMKILGRQFVMGANIASAIKRAKEQENSGYRYSYDMLGEAACNREDAKMYFDNYMSSIIAIGENSAGRGPIHGPGVSVKLSALHPRYEYKNKAKVMRELYPRLLELVLEAKRYNIGFTLDAEEADRLEIFIDIFEKLMADDRLRDWHGLGLALQAYQKRAIPLIKWLGALSGKYQQYIMLRLVKGAYWDTEIKSAQVNGLEDYPVLTRKHSTDVSYIACIKEIIRNKKFIYPQFATHNAYSVGVVMELCKDMDFEFQCLHGMGDALYQSVVSKSGYNIPCRIYAPVGGYDNLLAYLVRRLLENGANTSFVNRIVDERAPIEEIIADPCSILENFINYRHDELPKPIDLYGENRINSSGIDINHPRYVEKVLSEINELTLRKTWASVPLYNDLPSGVTKPCVAPANNNRQIGMVTISSHAQISKSIDVADVAFSKWENTRVEDRAKYLRRYAELLEENKYELYALLTHEAGKTIDDVIGEVREAVDFCRYYANLAEKIIQPNVLPGPTGERNILTLHGRGVFLCISPWNFPLAIFIGQVCAALISGNTVLAKPASQTPLIAALAIELLHKAGVAQGVVQLLVANGKTINDIVIPDLRIQGIMFTGSNQTAKQIQQGISSRDGAIIPFIAETGGMNAMIVDSTSLIEQVIADVISSAYGSAGQRCSALRVLYVQDDIIDGFIKTLSGAMLDLTVGDPEVLSTDIGPVIDSHALQELQHHENYLRNNFKFVAKAQISTNDEGYFFGPCAYIINGMSDLPGEVFGPILHIAPYKAEEIDRVIDDINAVGYGLTFGMHSRIDEQVEYVTSRIKVGNIYINRNMVGAVVGTQPFGGHGLSGTGPKAGGPNYLHRLMIEKTTCTNTTAAGGNASLLSLGD
ncbi:MAG: bifunctional proline dehydrogenase/L-glutamate gamma-semialdehyde dehydrogenase PutA [Francisellaceae bacterium]|nr:bifunctional proline dehydrogenase/L-glutamate gamma-semialdehyde dehydrogenase PutA [Francisellaceae bacterium]MBT6537925.1 bifunctional proline dehydrogenase/L-glutamate gamma-semialdehyde dehydrogenase PutA [Francisellaceae bacterium]